MNHVTPDVTPDVTPRADAALLDSLRQGFTLPAAWYTDAALFDVERARIFRRSWQFAGYAEQLGERGAYFTTRVGDTPLILTRDQSGEIHAFVNVCRHRGSDARVGLIAFVRTTAR